jgi:(E)-4-hydroxy-3-methylbut-2-enyl-diphosphate synthase
MTVQTMTNTDTCDVAATVAQIQRCVAVGATIIVRISVPSMEAAEAFGLIRQQVMGVPLVADIHFDHRIALAVAEHGALTVCVLIRAISATEDKIREVIACARDKGLVNSYWC